MTSGLCVGCSEWRARRNPGGQCAVLGRLLRLGDDGAPEPPANCPRLPKPEPVAPPVVELNHNVAVMSSSKDMDWETPQSFVDALPFEFTLDACATAGNAKASQWITPEEDALQLPWEGVVWMNPPYGRQVGRWIEKALKETLEHHAVVVVLVPNRTETRWFDIIWAHAAVICFLGTRIKFLHPDVEKARNGAPFASVLAVFDGVGVVTEQHAEQLAELGTVIRPGYGNIWLRPLGEEK